MEKTIEQRYAIKLYFFHYKFLTFKNKFKTYCVAENDNMFPVSDVVTEGCAGMISWLVWLVPLTRNMMYVESDLTQYTSILFSLQDTSSFSFFKFQVFCFPVSLKN
jgi:hypothetical protein